jgi:hypothetical protein
MTNVLREACVMLFEQHHTCFYYRMFTICNVKFCRLVDYDVVAEYHRRQMNLENSWYSCML